MSSIGPGSIGALNIAGSFAGAQRTESASNSAKAESSERNFQIDQKGLSARSLEDVSEADLSADRDPDGRLPFSNSEEPQEPGDEKSSLRPGRSRSHASDPFGERGISLDLDA